MRKHTYLILLMALIGISFFFLERIYGQAGSIYPLSGQLFLEKQDYFSQYNVIQKSDDQYVTLISGVSKISVQVAPLFVKTKLGETYLIRGNAAWQAPVDPGITFQNPWNFVEQYTLNHSDYLILQIIQITLIVLFTLLVMKFFNLTPLASQGKWRFKGNTLQEYRKLFW